MFLFLCTNNANLLKFLAMNFYLISWHGKLISIWSVFLVKYIIDANQSFPRRLDQLVVVIKDKYNELGKLGFSNHLHLICMIKLMS